MHVCGVCGAEFDPSGYQLVVNGRSYHSVDCAVRALETTMLEVGPAPSSQEEQHTESPGRVYSLSGIVGLSDERRSPDHPLAAS